MEHVELASKAKLSWQAYGKANTDRLAAFHETGQHLLKLKAECEHGDWLPYLEDIGIEERTAQRAMRIAKNVTLSDLEKMGSIAKALDQIERDNTAYLAEAVSVEDLQPPPWAPTTLASAVALVECIGVDWKRDSEGSNLPDKVVLNLQAIQDLQGGWKVTAKVA
ncbi:hypothetical protein [Candidatus Rariloculus sp.]|uniref:hypothetical protein n=1 Tax=Candidatus Rariloculus sp. TaxID=3101265 RepID=UPI003D0A5FC1